jgi:hypothetical protein
MLTRIFGDKNSTYAKEIQNYIARASDIPSAQINVTDYIKTVRVEITDVKNISPEQLYIVGQLLAAFPLKIQGDAHGKKATYKIGTAASNIFERVNDLKAKKIFDSHIRPILRRAKAAPKAI